MQDSPVHTSHRGRAARSLALPSAIVSLTLLAPAVAVAQPAPEPAPVPVEDTPVEPAPVEPTPAPTDPVLAPAEPAPTPAPAPAPTPTPEVAPAPTTPPPQPMPAPPPELQYERVPPAPPAESVAPTQFDNSFDMYIAPGALNVPYGGIDDVDYGASFDPGYQWGLGLGYFGRGSSDFAIGVGGFFDHAIINAEGRQLGDDASEHLFRVGLELRPGVVIGERVFLNVPLRGGYVGDVVHIGDETNVNHGPMFGVGGGLDVAIARGFYVGTAVGTDLQFFRAGRDFDAYLFTWRTLLGYRF